MKEVYSNFTINSQNCYLTFGCVGSQDCNYGHIIWESSNCLDCLYTFQSQWCAYCIDIAGSYEVFYSIEAVNCRQSYFLYDCKNCNDCFACYNLRNKQYCFMNQQYSKEEYYEKISKLLPLTTEKVSKLSLWLQNIIKNVAVKPEFFGNQSEDVIGDHIYNCKNLFQCFDAKKTIDSNYVYTGLNISNSLDLSFTAALSNFCIDSLTISRCERVIHSHYCVDSYELSYCDFCINCKYCFACVGLKNSEYCILNKQYTKDEYYKLKDIIITNMKSVNEYGSFFSPDMSPFAYNESVAYEYYPLTKEQAILLGYSWKDEIENIEKHDSKFFTCKKSGKQFKIIKKEKDFLDNFKLPNPEICYKERHFERMLLRNERKLNRVNCMKCNQSLISANKLRVLCEKCYQDYLQ